MMLMMKAFIPKRKLPLLGFELALHLFSEAYHFNSRANNAIFKSVVRDLNLKFFQGLYLKAMGVIQRHPPSPAQ